MKWASPSNPVEPIPRVHPSLCILGLLGLLIARIATAKDPTPRVLIAAHSHNDYHQARPLVTALENGFGSVEADIHLVDGQLLVAHDRVATRPDRTLTSMYLEPLRVRCATNQGRVYPEIIGFRLLIDIKADPEGTYAVLDPLLRNYRDVLTRFTPTNTTPGAITVILSGARPTRTVAAQPERFCAIDGRPEDLDTPTSVHLIPIISESWPTLFGRVSGTSLSDTTREKLRAFVARAHGQGRQVRFWGAPDMPWFWSELMRADVDVVNTDRIPTLAAFMREAVGK